MKKVVFSMVALLASLGTMKAQVADGYYRVQNCNSGRYAYVIDNKGRIDAATTSIDLGAISLWKDFNKAVSDPATVVYFKQHTSSEYNLYAQGTDVYTFIGYYVKLRKRDSDAAGSYWAYASANGATKYLTDSEYSESEDGMMSDYGDYTSSRNRLCRNWYFKPITQKDDEYFGVLPELQIGDAYYATIYAGFPFSFASEGMKAFYVGKVSGDKAIITEVNGEVAASVPVLIRCSEASPSGNRLALEDLFSTSFKAPSGNMMRGVYFNNSEKTHLNRVAYNPATMRVLGLTSDGLLGFITADIDYLPANKAYLQVPEGTPRELRIMTQEDFEAGISDVGAERYGESGQQSGVYTLTGVKVREDAMSLEGLPVGIYIVNGKKVVVK